MSAPLTRSELKAGFGSVLRLIRSAERVRSGWCLTLMVVLGLTEGVGLMLLAPLLGSIGLTAEPGSGGSLRWLIAHLQDFGLPTRLEYILAVYLVLVGAHGVAAKARTMLVVKISENLVQRLRDDLFEVLTRTEWLYFSSLKSGETAHDLITLARTVGGGAGQLLILMGNFILAAIYLVLAAWLSLELTGLTLTVALLLVFLLWPYQVRSSRTGKELIRLVRRLYGIISEHLAGMKTSRSFGLRREHEQRFRKTTAEVRDRLTYFNRIQTSSTLIFQLVVAVSLSLLVYLAVTFFQVQGSRLLLLIFIFIRLLTRFAAIQSNGQHVAQAAPAMFQYQQRLNEFEAHRDPASGFSEGRIEMRRELFLKDLSFDYGPERPGAAISDLSIRVEAGRVVALVGPSGAGKSTLVDLLLGLIEPDRGAILVDGRPLRPEVRIAWRARVGYVPQEIFLFDGTLRENLLVGRPRASEADLWAALDSASARSLVESWPEGLETEVGERGGRLSGGERQRIALARALLRAPDLLLLDEATNALDPEAERRIKATLARLKGSLTVILIAHRPSTIRMADRIFFLEQGRLVEAGTWEELSSRPEGRFRAFVGD